MLPEPSWVVERRAEQPVVARARFRVLLGRQPAQDVGRFLPLSSSLPLPAFLLLLLLPVIMYLPVSFLMAPHPCPNQVMEILSS